jgi:hypothetical protein
MPRKKVITVAVVAVLRDIQIGVRSVIDYLFFVANN